MSEELRSWRQRLSDHADRQIDHLVGFFRAVFPVLVVGAAAFAFFTQPLVRYMDAYAAYGGAFVLVLALVLAAAAFVFKRDIMAAVVGVVGSLIGYGMLGLTLEQAAQRASINEQRCEQIERQLMKPVRDHGDLPALFSALGCTPRTNLILVFHKQ